MQTTEPHLLSHQGELVNDTDSHPLCFVAGVRSGKTWGLCCKAIMLGLANGDIPILFVEPTYRMLEDVALRTFLAVLDEWGLPYSWHKTSMTLRIHAGEGFDVLLRSADSPERLMGITAGAALMDEAGQCKESVAKELLKRVSHPKARVRQLVLGGTPEGAGTWYHEWSETEPREGSRLIRARTYDNPHLDEDYINQVLAYLSPEEAQQYLDGLFVPKGGRVYHRFDRSRHVATAPDLRGARVQMWCDFNISNQAWAFARVVGGEAHVFDECVGEGPTEVRAELAVAALKRYGVRPQEVDVYCDATGVARKTSATMSDVLLLKRAGFKSVRHPAANPAVRDRIAAVNLALAEDRLFFDPKAKYHLQCIEQQGRDKHNEPDKSSGLDHGADSVGYGVCNQWPVRVHARGNVMRYH